MVKILPNFIKIINVKKQEAKKPHAEETKAHQNQFAKIH